MLWGLYISGNTIGGLFGRLFISYVTDAVSWRIAIGALAAVSFLMGVFFWGNLPPSRHFRPKRTFSRSMIQSFVKLFKDPGLVCLFGIGGLLMSGFVTLYNYMGFRLLHAPYHLSQSFVGSIFIVHLAGTFSSSWMGRLADRLEACFGSLVVGQPLCI